MDLQSVYINITCRRRTRNRQRQTETYGEVRIRTMAKVCIGTDTDTTHQSTRYITFHFHENRKLSVGHVALTGKNCQWKWKVL